MMMMVGGVSAMRRGRGGMGSFVVVVVGSGGRFTGSVVFGRVPMMFFVVSVFSDGNVVHVGLKQNFRLLGWIHKLRYKDPQNIEPSVHRPTRSKMEM